MGGTKSPYAPSTMAYSINERVKATAAKADNKDEADKGATMGAPTKVVPGAGKELPRLDQGVERIKTVMDARMGSAFWTKCPLWWPTTTGNSVELEDLGNTHNIAPTDGSDAEDALDKVLKAELCASTALGRARE